MGAADALAAAVAAVVAAGAARHSTHRLSASRILDFKFSRLDQPQYLKQLVRSMLLANLPAPFA